MIFKYLVVFTLFLTSNLFGYSCKVYTDVNNFTCTDIFDHQFEEVVSGGNGYNTCEQMQFDTNSNLDGVTQFSNHCDDTDTVKPVFENNTPTQLLVNHNSVTFKVDISEAGKVYAVIVLDGSTAPTSEQVKNGQDSDGQSLSTKTELLFGFGIKEYIEELTISGLIPETSYDLYVVALDDDDNLQATPTKLDVTTTVNNEDLFDNKFFDKLLELNGVNGNLSLNKDLNVSELHFFGDSNDPNIWVYLEDVYSNTVGDFGIQFNVNHAQWEELPGFMSADNSLFSIKNMKIQSCNSGNFEIRGYKGDSQVYSKAVTTSACSNDPDGDMSDLKETLSSSVVELDFYDIDKVEFSLTNGTIFIYNALFVPTTKVIITSTNGSIADKITENNATLTPNSLPNWISFNSNNNTLTGTAPASEGLYDLSFSDNNSDIIYNVRVIVGKAIEMQTLSNISVNEDSFTLSLDLDLKDFSLSKDINLNIEVSDNSLLDVSIKENPTRDITNISNDDLMILDYNHSAVLILEPKENAHGSATVTVTATNNQNNQIFDSKQFLVTVNSVADKPSFNLSNTSNSGVKSWANIATTNGNVTYTSTQRDGNGVPYIIFVEDTVVKFYKYNQGNDIWELIEANDSFPALDSSSLVEFRIEGEALYVAYTYENNTKLEVQKYINNSWEQVSTTITEDKFVKLDLELDKDGVPYLAFTYNETIDSHPLDRLKLINLDNENWSQVGDILGGYSTRSTDDTTDDYYEEYYLLDLAFDKNSTQYNSQSWPAPYLAFTNKTTSHPKEGEVWNGNVWQEDLDSTVYKYDIGNTNPEELEGILDNGTYDALYRRGFTSGKFHFINNEIYFNGVNEYHDYITLIKYNGTIWKYNNGGECTSAKGVDSNIDIFHGDHENILMSFSDTRSFIKKYDALNDACYTLGTSFDNNGIKDISAIQTLDGETFAILGTNQGLVIKQLVNKYMVSTNENESFTVSIDGFDPDGDNLTYSLSGEDSAYFTYSTNGALTLKFTPDYEDANDTDYDNIYTLILTVEDSTGLSQSFPLDIKIENEVEPTIVTSTPPVVEIYLPNQFQYSLEALADRNLNPIWSMNQGTSEIFSLQVYYDQGERIAGDGVFYSEDINVSGDGRPALESVISGSINPNNIHEKGSIDITTDNNGNIYIIDDVSKVVRKISSNGYISRIAGQYHTSGDASNGNALDSYFKDPQSIAVDNDGNIYVSGFGGSLSKISPNGAMQVLSTSSFNSLTFNSDKSKLYGYRYFGSIQGGSGDNYCRVYEINTTTGELIEVFDPNFNTFFDEMIYSNNSLIVSSYNASGSDYYNGVYKINLSNSSLETIFNPSEINSLASDSYGNVLYPDWLSSNTKIQVFSKNGENDPVSVMNIDKNSIYETIKRIHIDEQNNLYYILANPNLGSGYQIYKAEPKYRLVSNATNSNYGDNQASIKVTNDVGDSINHDFSLYVTGPAYDLYASVIPGSVLDTIKISTTQDENNKIFYDFTDIVSQENPEWNTTLPNTATQYSLGDNISDVQVGDYINIYEVNSKDMIVKFVQIPIELSAIQSETVMTVDNPYQILYNSVEDINLIISGTDINGDISISINDQTNLPSWLTLEEKDVKIPISGQGTFKPDSADNKKWEELKYLTDPIIISDGNIMYTMNVDTYHDESYFIKHLTDGTVSIKKIDAEILKARHIDKLDLVIYSTYNASTLSFYTYSFLNDKINEIASYSGTLSTSQNDFDENGMFYYQIQDFANYNIRQYDPFNQTYSTVYAFNSPITEMTINNNNLYTITGNQAMKIIKINLETNETTVVADSPQKVWNTEVDVLAIGNNVLYNPTSIKICNEEIYFNDVKGILKIDKDGFVRVVTDIALNYAKTYGFSNDTVYITEYENNVRSLSKIKLSTLLTGNPSQGEVGRYNILFDINDTYMITSYKAVIDIIGDGPYGIDISNDNVVENIDLSSNSLIGTILAIPHNGTTVSNIEIESNDYFELRNENELHLIVSPNYEENSSLTVDVNVTDSMGNSTTQEITVHINNVNEVPTWSIENNSTDQDSVLIINLNTMLSDPDTNDIITYYVENNNSNLLDTVINNGTLSIISKGSNGGVVNVTLSAYDGDSNISKDINITINPVDTPPVLGDGKEGDNDGEFDIIPEATNTKPNIQSPLEYVEKKIKGKTYAIYSDADQGGKLSIMRKIDEDTWEYVDGYKGIGSGVATDIVAKGRRTIDITYKDDGSIVSLSLRKGDL